MSMLHGDNNDVVSSASLLLLWSYPEDGAGGIFNGLSSAFQQ